MERLILDSFDKCMTVKSDTEAVNTPQEPSYHYNEHKNNVNFGNETVSVNTATNHHNAVVENEVERIDSLSDEPDKQKHDDNLGNSMY